MKPFSSVKKMTSGSFKNVVYKICSCDCLIHMYKEDLALNDL